MRQFAIILAAAICLPGRAASEDLPPGFVRPTVLTKHLTKKTPCFLYMFATMDVPQLRLKDVAGTDVLCIWNGVVEAGTVNEKSGCMLGVYYSNKATYGIIDSNDGGIALASGKKCSVQTALALMESKLWFSNGPSRTVTLMQVYAPHPMPNLKFQIGGTGPVVAYRQALQNTTCKDLPPPLAKALDCPKSDGTSDAKK